MTPTSVVQCNFALCHCLPGLWLGLHIVMVRIFGSIGGRVVFLHMGHPKWFPML